MQVLTHFLLRRGFLATLLVAGLTLLLFMGCGRVETTLTGKVMGTTYMVKVIAERFARTGHLKALVAERLAAVEQSMSTYLPDSEISRFNTLQTAGEPFTPSPDFLAVMRVAAEIHAATEGAWDGTLDPLITLWGFGREQQSGRVPDADDIQALLARVDFGRIAITADGQLVKLDGRMSLDLASIAKGYGVDAVARMLENEGYGDFLVEVGGEVFAAGRRADGKPWRVGINRPSRGAGYSEVYKVVELTDKGFATSGDYRIYFEADGRFYTHILDPRTGYPVANGVISASVLADTCTLADGLATALMVMGPSDGLELVNTLPGVEALIIVGKADGSFEEHASTGFVAMP